MEMTGIPQGMKQRGSSLAKFACLSFEMSKLLKSGNDAMQKYLIILSLAIIIIFGIFLNQLPEHEIIVIANTGKYIVFTMFLVIFLAILAISIFFSMIWYEKWQTAKQQRFDAGRRRS